MDKTNKKKITVERSTAERTTERTDERTDERRKTNEAASDELIDGWLHCIFLKIKIIITNKFLFLLFIYYLLFIYILLL